MTDTIYKCWKCNSFLAHPLSDCPTCKKMYAEAMMPKPDYDPNDVKLPKESKNPNIFEKLSKAYKESNSIQYEYFRKMPEDILDEKLHEKAVKDLYLNMSHLGIINAEELISYKKARSVLKSIEESDDYIGLLANAGDKLNSDIREYRTELGEKIMALLMEDFKDDPKT